MKPKHVFVFLLFSWLAVLFLPAILVADDGGTAEVGVEWITDWPGTANDRANWYYSANDLYNKFFNRGWLGRFNYGETNAWEKDFKAAAYGGNGLIDTVDLGMIGTHGTSALDPKWNKNLSAVSFTSNKDGTTLSPGEAYRYYGTNDLEWLIFDSCSVLRDDSLPYWYETFNGLHLMMGFANTMYVVYRGDGGAFADRAIHKHILFWTIPALTVTQAWFSGTDDEQPSGVRARVVAEDLDNYNDYVWGEGYVSADHAHDGGWYWDHVSGTPPPIALIGDAPSSLPMYKIRQRNVDKNYVADIGWAFGLTDPNMIYDDDFKFYMMDGEAQPPSCYECNDGKVPGKLLIVEKASGGFSFLKLGELWTQPTMARPNLPTNAKDALTLTSLFFRQKGEALPGYHSQYSQRSLPTFELEGVAPLPTMGAEKLAAAPTYPTNWAVSYGRSVAAAGQQLSVVGPGSRYNAYVGANEEMAGMKGGWRDVEPVLMSGSDGPLAQTTVPIKTAIQAWSDFLNNPGIALAQPPFGQYNLKTTPAPTLAYYEQALNASQNELIPVWVFVADVYTTETQALKQDPLGASTLVASDVSIYVPAASADSAMPSASITKPAVGTKIVAGASLGLEGTATGGTPPYTYLWSSSVDGDLGTGATLTVPGGLHTDLRDGVVQPTTITLTVTDADAKQATAKLDVTVLIPLHLPLIVR